MDSEDDGGESTAVDWTNVGERLAGLMTARALQAPALANATRVSKQTAYNWLSGKPMNGESAFRVASVLHISVDALLRGTSPAPSAPALTPRVADADRRARELADALVAMLARAEEAHAVAGTVIPDLMAALKNAERLAADLSP